MGTRGSKGENDRQNKAIYAASGGVITSAEEREITTEMVKKTRHGSYPRNEYEKEVLEATVDKSGNVNFDYPTFKRFDNHDDKHATVTYYVTAGAVNGETFNIDWSKVNSVSGKTFALKDAAKKAGLRWNGSKSIWERR